MAVRLSDLVRCGALINTRKNCVHGHLRLEGFTQPLVFELTGNCAADLVGQHIRFEVRGGSGPDEPSAEGANEEEDAGACGGEDDAEGEQVELARLGLAGLAWAQIGPTGTMTLAREVRVPDCPPAELCVRRKLGELPPTAWRRCLYLEWFGQNGRVVVELVDPVVEIVESKPLSAAGEYAASLSRPGDDDPRESGERALGITSAEWAADDQAVIRAEALDLEAIEDPSEMVEKQSDSYGLFPDDLQRQLDEQARATDRVLHEDAEGAEVIREMELMDDLIEQGAGEPVGTLFDDAVRLRRPDQLDEQEAEQELKVLLARLALYGIALDMCEHFTAVAAYRLLVERICREETAYPELRGTQWVQHFATSDFCPECQAEFERA